MSHLIRLWGGPAIDRDSIVFVSRKMELLAPANNALRLKRSQPVLLIFISVLACVRWKWQAGCVSECEKIIF